jgi:protein-disulfide isomerase
MKRYLPFVLIGAVMLLGIVAYVTLVRSSRMDSSAPFATEPSSSVTGAAASSPSTRQAPGPPLLSQASPSPQEIPAVPLPSNIPAGVTVTIEEFGDYQCPPCGLLHPELKKIAAEYGGKVKIVFRNFPLTMNHKNAQAAAQAAEAARLQGHFDEMHDRIYEHQDEWKDLSDPRPVFAKYAQAIGLDLKRYASEVEGSEVLQKIEFDKQTALARGVNGTPTVFIEGRQLKPELTNLAGLRSGINITLIRKAGAN